MEAIATSVPSVEIREDVLFSYEIYLFKPMRMKLKNKKRKTN